MLSQRRLPPEFVSKLDELERSYLLETDPIRASGFGGGSDRWRAEREPLLDGVTADGDILDVGCACGHLLACLVAWGKERGLELTPHGVDRSARLVERARAALPNHERNVHVADAWEWAPSRRYRWVYSVCDCVPEDYLAEYVHRLLLRVVDPGGRLILGAYGSRSRSLAPFHIPGFLEDAGYEVAGTSSGGGPPVALFAWLDSPERGRAGGR